MRLGFEMEIRRFIGLVGFGLVCGLAVGQEFNVPDGWKAQKVGADYVVTPGDLAAGERMEVVVKPPQASQSTALRDWALEQVKADQPNRGKLLRDGDLQTMLSGGAFNVGKVFEGSGGEKIVAYYVAFARADRQRQMTITIMSLSNSIAKRYTEYAGQITADLIKARGTSAPVKEPAAPPKPTPDGFSTAPGKGVKPSDIEGVYMYLTYQAGVGGYVYPTYRPYLLLKDGSCLKSFAVPPADLDIAKSRKLEQDKWTRWKRDGGNLSIQKSDGTWSTSSMKPAKPGAANDVLSGSFRHVTGGGNTAVGGSTVVSATSTVSFLPGQRFDWGRTASATTPGVVTGSSKNTQGAYRIDGYTIVFKFDDGRVERRAFAYMDADLKDAIYIGDTAYIRRK